MTAHPGSFREPLPDSVEAEQALLGAIFLSNEVYWRVAGFLLPKHFDGGEGGPHGILWSTIGQMMNEGRPVNALTVRPYLPDIKIGEVPFFAYVISIQSGAVGTAAAYENARAIIETWARRQIIARLEDGIALARNMPVDCNPEKIIGLVSTDLTKIAAEGNERAGATKYGVVLPNAISKVQDQRTDARARIPWFLTEMNEALGDIRRGNLVGLMSDSGGGKTSFSLQQCRFAAERGFRSAFFSIEITEEEAALQAAAQVSRISLPRIDEYRLNTKEMDDLGNEIIASASLPFWIVGFGECSLTDIRIKAEAMTKSHGLDLLMIDHAKMIALPGKPGELFAERINMLYRGLKAIAKTLNIAVIILIQRNDDWKTRWRSGGSMRPMMGDAYGGGSIKQSLDVWFSLYRPEPLLKELIPSLPPERISEKDRQEGRKTRKEEMVGKMLASEGKAWVINHKRRRGEPGRSPQIGFDAEFTAFKSLTEERPESLFGETF